MHLPKFSRQTTLALVCLVCGAIGIGFAPIFVRLSAVGPFATGFWRVALALPFLTLISLCSKRDHRPQSPVTYRDYGWLLLSGVFFALDLAVWHLSIGYTSVANATMLANFTPFIIAIWGWLALKQRPKLFLLGGLVCALLGLVLLVNPSFHLSARAWLGNAYGLAAAFFYSGYFIIINRVRLRFNTFTLMAWSAFSSAVVLYLLSFLANETFIVHSLAAWGILFGLAIISQVLGQALIAYALPFLPLIFSAATLIIQPIVAAGVAWFLFAEALGVSQMLGILVCFIGIYLIKVNS